MENVSIRECEGCRREMEKQLDELKAQQTKDQADIVDLKIIAAELKQIVQNLVARDQSPTTKIWSQPWFKYVIITICIIITLLTVGAISDNVITRYLDVVKVIPK